MFHLDCTRICSYDHNSSLKPIGISINTYMAKPIPNVISDFEKKLPLLLFSNTYLKVSNIYHSYNLLLYTDVKYLSGLTHKMSSFQLLNLHAKNNRKYPLLGKSQFMYNILWVFA